MNIGVLVICTGKYDIFFKGLFETSEQFFLKNHNKKYFVFTDSEEIIDSDNVKTIKQKFLGWPYDTMYRFKMFKSIEKELLALDYIFFLNANLLFLSEVSEEVLPVEKNDFLCGVNHPGYFNKSKNEFPYERREGSCLYIPIEDGKKYFQGCFLGGSSLEFMEMSKILEEKIDIDLKNNIIPIYHDESALNWYYKDKNPLVLDSGYSYPESVIIPFDKKIIQRDKRAFGGYDYLRQSK